MKYSLNAIIEAWLSGILFLTTIILLFLRLFWGTLDTAIFLDVYEEWISFIVIILCTFAYAIGWAVNFLAEQLLDRIFQHPFRRKLEKEMNLCYMTVRANLFQYGSEQSMNDIKYDRQLIRIARSNSLNFFLMGIVIGSFYWIDDISHSFVFFFFFLCICISVVSFFQWISRFKATYRKFYQYYDELPSGQKHAKPIAVKAKQKKK